MTLSIGTDEVQEFVDSGRAAEHAVYLQTAVGTVRRRRAFYIDETMAVDGGYIPHVVVEGEPGMTPMSGNGEFASPWVWGPSLAKAREQAASATHRLFGVTEGEARVIVLSSFAAQNA